MVPRAERKRCKIVFYLAPRAIAYWATSRPIRYAYVEARYIRLLSLI